MRAGWGKKAAEGSTSTEHHEAEPDLEPVERKNDRGIYALGALFGLIAGFLDVKFGDLLLTALFVLAATMFLGSAASTSALALDFAGRRLRAGGSMRCLFCSD